MVKLSVNVNKIATLRNSRGEDYPQLLLFVKDLIQRGVLGITVHPRPDGRHILYKDVKEIGEYICQYSSKSIELNVEGYPSQDFLNLLQTVLPHQCTLVPDSPETLTSNQGWNLQKNQRNLEKILKFLKTYSIRSSLFIDPLLFNEEDLEVLGKLSPHRVEFYTGAWAKYYDEKNLNNHNMKNQKKNEVEQFKNLPSNILDIYRILSEKISKMGIGINAGHDLNQQNLKPLLKAVPLIQEVSIGHAFVCESIYEGLEQTLNKYFNILKE